MRKIVAGLCRSLDGVAEAPYKWIFPYWTDEMDDLIRVATEQADAVLLGRRTYLEFAGLWPGSDAPMADFMQRSLARPEPSVPIVHGTRGHENATVFVSIVWAIDGPRFVAVARTEEDCLTQIARYVAEQAQWQLWPPTANRVATLLGGGDQAGAVTEYFHHVGERWDTEWLTTARLGLDPASGVWSGSLPLSVRSPASRRYDKRGARQECRLE